MISHENTMLYVSPAEAARLDDETANRLLKDHKLSLILDLDQTVIHATVNPQLDSLLDQPKWAAHPVTRDVHRFMLPDNQGYYHVKLRPGLLQFLRELSKWFELHIYTMGTRHYAKAVAKIIDPKGEIFKERILSRDESGSFTKKTIQRLFPCDDSMVIVVDDRADVWEWSDNLIKVRPYTFFHNTGDINAPPNDIRKVNNSIQVVKSILPGEELKKVETIEPAKLVDYGAWESDEMKSELPPPVTEDTDKTELKTSSSRDLNNPDQELDEEIDTLIGIAEHELPFNLHESDNELQVLTGILKQVHSLFYLRFQQLETPINLQNRKIHDIDAKHILGRIKGQVFRGFHFVFSGIIPVSQKPEKSEIWKFATTFGAQCSLDISDNTTHLIASRWGTDKVRQAAKLQNSSDKKLWIVKPAWLYDSVHTWNRKSEMHYLLQNLERSPIAAELEASLENSRAINLERPSSSLSLAIEHDSFLNEDDVLDISKEIAEELGSEMSDDDEEDDISSNERIKEVEFEDDELADNEAEVLSKMSFTAQPVHQGDKVKPHTDLPMSNPSSSSTLNKIKRKNTDASLNANKKQKGESTSETRKSARSTKPRRPSPLGKTPVSGEVADSIIRTDKTIQSKLPSKRKRKQANSTKAPNDETESDFDVDAFVADIDADF